jgi:glutamate dehydrogenase
MLDTAGERKSKLIDKLIHALAQRLPEAQLSMVQMFTQQYYAWVPSEDLLDDDLEDLYGAMLSHWNFTRHRQVGSASIRVYNPDFEFHNWQSTHTVIEIVTDDMPFLVDSVTMELNRHGLTVHRIIHPLIRVKRDETGRLQTILSPSETAGMIEAVMHIQVDRQTDPSFLRQLEHDLERILGDVRAAVEDWPAMQKRMLAIADGLDTQDTNWPIEEDINEVKAFLNWLTNNHFTFLGYRNYDLVKDSNGQLLLRTAQEKGLGILRDDSGGHISRSFAMLPELQRKLVYAPNLLIITKASARSTVHRPAHLDYIGIKRLTDDGQVEGEWRFLGLYTSRAYGTRPFDIPLLRNKVKRILQRAALVPISHSGKMLQHILDTFPRDDLLQATEDKLFTIAIGILHLQERQRLRLFVREDTYGRFVSCLVYVPRDRYNTELRLRIQTILMQAFNGLAVEFTTQFSESILARVLFHVRTQANQIPDYSIPELESRLREAMLSWQDELQRALLEHCGEAQGNVLLQRYGNAFPVGYQDDFTTRTAVHDILRLEEIDADHPLAMHLYRTLEDPEGLLRFKLFSSQPIPLSDVLPVLERLGLRVVKAKPYEIELSATHTTLWIVDFDMQEDDGIRVDATQVRDIFQEAFARIWNREMENDGFNRLVLGAGLAWRDVVILRAYCKYLLQTRIPFSQTYMEQTLTRHPPIAKHLAELFSAQFDPHLIGDHGRRTTALGVAIEQALENVSSLDEDRIVRRFLNVMQATLRTNYFQTDSKGQPKEYLSFKFDPSIIDELPLPRPMFEIFVYSPRVEAVHLRGGPVARGGLRWSDRREDFRTEVLGLMKAQMVKNAVIVPVGSKGGFVVKRPPSERQALDKEVLYCYQTFIRGMLDITDNRVKDMVISPPRVVRHDMDDPYLVVAADKGTATFSDVANGIAKEYGFWLGDAFASGGSAGYDHKRMGITARGAWESVKRHFRELGMDIQNRDDFTVVGIGDMSGDVFGNGMLLSRHIKLLVAFNHLHIFIDPNPDPEISFKERERLFQLSRSSWEDYDKNLLSAGGGIYTRSSKSIRVSPEACQALGLKQERFTPNELIQQVLKAPVDLLWNGGIGTYVKAAAETHTEVGDKSNDLLRINGRDLRCRVVGEGGNLGFTQRGRIEYAQYGGKILTDAIDNAGGVNCSDHEVNIKILLNQAVRNGDMTAKQRNQLLAKMTTEVGELVLRQNYLQPQAISMIHARAADLLGDHARVIRGLEKMGKLDRTLEFLPSDQEITEREATQQGLTTPEIAVLLAYGKIALYEELLESDVPEDAYLRNELLAYFPSPLRETFAQEMDNHPLRREIIATYITNSMLNRMGSSFAFRLWEETGEPYPNIARAYTAARELFDIRQLWSAIESLDSQVPAELQIFMMSLSQRLLERSSLWLLRHRRSPLAIEAIVSQFQPGVATLKAELPNLLKAAELEQLETAQQRFLETQVPEELARWVASLDALYCAFDLVEVAEQRELPVTVVATVYFALISHLNLNWLRQNIAELPVTSHWQNRARSALLNGLYDQGRLLTADVFQSTSPDDAPAKRLTTWFNNNQSKVERCQNIFTDLRSAGQPDLAMLSVALRETASLVQQ